MSTRKGRHKLCRSGRRTAGFSDAARHRSGRPAGGLRKRDRSTGQEESAQVWLEFRIIIIISHSRSSSSIILVSSFAQTVLYLAVFASAVFVALIYCRRVMQRRQTSNFATALKQIFRPKEAGFNRLSLDEELSEHLIRDDSDSDSEIFSRIHPQIKWNERHFYQSKRNE